MPYLVAYIVSLVVFGIVDAIWLSLVGASLYRSVLGDLLAPTIRLAPAAAFYAAYPIGLVVFCVLPALRSDSVMTALGLGLLFGAIAYATYDLTNFATLRTWSLQITVMDICYGAVASAAAAAAAFYAVRTITGWSNV